MHLVGPFHGWESGNLAPVPHRRPVRYVARGHCVPGPWGASLKTTEVYALGERSPLLSWQKQQAGFP